MNREKLEQLFAEYENAFDKLNMELMARYFDEKLITAGPKGTIAHDKKDFVNMALHASEMYRSIGQNSARILSKKIITISDEYTMVTVRWGVTFKRTGDRVIEFDVSYLVRQIGNDTKIILFISHEDEEEAMKNLGLKPEMSSH